MSVLKIIPFRRDIVDEIAGILGNDPSYYRDTCVVFQGKRPFLYLKKILASRNGREAFFPPLCMSLDELIDSIAETELSGFTGINRLNAVWLIFDLISTLPEFHGHPFRKKGFGEFFTWGLYLLNFIDRLDMECIDSKALVNVEKNAAIGYDIPASINEFLANISTLREAFHSRLAANGWSTRGFRHLCAARRIGQVSPPLFDRIIFAGLFGLTGTERRVVKSFWDSGNATVLLSGDPGDWPILKDLVSYLGASPGHTGEPVSKPVMHLHAGRDSHAEIIETYRILSQDQFKRTAIILPVPDPLFPLLNFVTGRLNAPCNISLGYPLERTSLFDLVRRVLNARIEMRADGRYPVSHYLGVISHPFVKNLYPEKYFRKIIFTIEKYFAGDISGNVPAGKATVSLNEIETVISDAAALPEIADAIDVLTEVHRLLFGNFRDVSVIGDAVQSITALLETITENTPVRSYFLSGPVFEGLFEGLESLRTVLFCGTTLDADPSRNIRAICSLTLDHLGSYSVPFDTQPVEDLEVLGMLEARNLAFDRVIILDVNEGVLPGPREVNPVIPVGVFEALKIPSPEFTESVYRYNFYRLAGSAREVHLVYRSSDEAARSRYVEEIVWNEERKAKKLNIIPVGHTAFPVDLKKNADPPVIEKSPQALDALIRKGFSPTSLDAYVQCPLLYYFTRLMRFTDRPALSGEIDAAKRGEMIHRILYDTFYPFLTMTLTQDNKKEVAESLKRAIIASFAHTKQSGEMYMLERLVSYKLARYIDKFFGNLTDPVSIEYLEDDFSAGIKLENIEINLSGKIDRVDRNLSTGHYTIIDYKTGTYASRYPAKILGKADFADMVSVHENVPSFQLPVYILMFAAAKKIPVHSINATLAFLGDNKDEQFFKKSGDDDRSRLMTEYEKGVRTVISDIVDMKKPFGAHDTKNCAQCPARDLCHV